MKNLIKTAAFLIVGWSIAANSQSQNLFVSDIGGSGNIFNFATNGVPSTFATGRYAGLAFDKFGNLFVSGSGNIYKFTTNGARSTFATGLNIPYGLAFDKAGNLFEADFGSGSIFKFTTNGVQSTFATGLNNPYGLAFDNSGNLFEADFGSGSIFKFTASGVKSTFATGLSIPIGLAFQGNGNLFETDSGSGNIFQFTPSGVKSTFATGLRAAFGLAFDQYGNLFVADAVGGNLYAEGGNIFKFTPNGAKTTFATLATGLSEPVGLAFQENETMPTPPYLSVSLSLTFSKQSGSNVVGTVLTTASPTSLKLATKDILNVLAADENLEGHWPSNSFPKNTTLALAGNTFVVLNGTNVLLNVSEIMSLEYDQGQVTSGKRNLATGLASTSAGINHLANVVFDDTLVNGGYKLQLFLYGVLNQTTTDTAPANGVYTETQTISSTTVLGDGFAQNVPFTCTGTFSATGKSPLHL